MDGNSPRRPIPFCQAGRLTGEQYHDMTRFGILTEDAPIELPEGSLVMKRAKNAAHGLADVALTVEVADISLARDRGVKKCVYARAAVPVYWVVNWRTREWGSTATRPVPPPSRTTASAKTSR